MFRSACEFDKRGRRDRAGAPTGVQTQEHSAADGPKAWDTIIGVVWLFKKMKPCSLFPCKLKLPDHRAPDTRRLLAKSLPKRKSCRWKEAAAARAADSAEPVRSLGTWKAHRPPQPHFFFSFCRDSCRLLSSSRVEKEKHTACFDTPTKEGAGRAGLAGAKGSERGGGGWRLKALPLQTLRGAEKARGAAQERVGWVGGWVAGVGWGGVGGWGHSLLKQRLLCYLRVFNGAAASKLCQLSSFRFPSS